MVINFGIKSRTRPLDVLYLRKELFRMDVFEAIKERRSCRAFLSEPIGEETINKIIEAAV